MNEIRTAAIIGAGVMGAGIAGLLADAGLAVTLLDIDPAAAERAAATQLGPTPARRIRAGSSVRDIGLVADADWIIEAAAERLTVKQEIFAALNAVRKTDSIVSSNTSTIPLAQLVAAMHVRHASSYVIAHFFNPPKHMRLLELVGGAATRPDAITALERFAAGPLGRCVVRCHDTPGFIANRIGNYWMAVALHEAVTRGIDIEQADALLCAFGSPVGLFGLLDIVGIDLLPSGWASLQSALAMDDPLQDYAAAPPLIAAMIAQGQIGRKAGAGFYRRIADGGIQVLDLRDLTYRTARVPITVSNDLPALIADHGSGSEFVAAVMDKTLAYAVALVPAIAVSPAEIDLAMREGYGWRYGPFELIERLGSDRFTDVLAAMTARLRSG